MEARDIATLRRQDTDITFEYPTPKRRQSYKPVSLRWPFLIAQIVLLLAAISAVLFVQLSMPDSDDSAYVDGRPMKRFAGSGEGAEGLDRTELRLAKRQVIGGGGFRPAGIPKAPRPALETTSATATEPSLGSFTSHSTLDPAPTSPALSSAGRPHFSRELDNTSVAGTNPGPARVDPSDFVIKGGGFRPALLPVATPAATAAITAIDTSGTPDQLFGSNHIVTALDTFSDVLVGVIKGGGGRPGAQPGTSPLVVTTTITFGTVKTAGGGFRPPSLPKATPPPKAATIPSDNQGGKSVTRLGIFQDVSESEPTTSAFPTGNRTSTTQSVVRWSSDYVELDGGPTTVLRPLRGPALFAANDLISTALPAKETQTFVTTLPATVTTVVVGPMTETIISKIEAIVITALVTQAATTILNTMDGVVATIVSIPPPRTVVSSVDASLMTVVTTKPPHTVASTIPGVPMTLVAVFSPLRPGLETVVSVIGGLETTVTPPPITFTSEINGKTVIFTSTPAPYTTKTGGTTTTVTRVNTTPRAITTAIATTIDGKLTSITMTLIATQTPEIGHPSDKDGGYNDGSTTHVFPGLTEAQYFAGAFLPTLIAVMLALPITVIDLNAKLFQPFHALSRPGGAAGVDSMMLRFGGIHAAVTPIRQLRQGQAVSFVTTLLLWLSWLLAPLAAESIGIKVHGVCSHLSISGCAIAVGVSPEPAHALAAVMAVMVALLVLLLALLHNWDTGVPYNPWSLAGVALLAQNYRLREPLIQLADPTEAELNELFRTGHFSLEQPSQFPPPMPKDEKNPTLTQSTTTILPSWPAPCPPISPTTPTVTTTISSPLQHPKPRHHNPFRSLSYPSRTLFTLLLLSLTTLLTTYHLSPPTSPLELFLDSQSFGVKFLFAALGSTVSFLWAAFASSLSTAAIFRRMYTAPQPAASSVAVVRESNAISAAVSAFQQRDWMLLAVQGMTALGEILPVVLSNVPYSLTQTRRTHDVCMGLSVGIMGGMVGLLVGGMWMRWPHMPVDPRTLGGCVWYVCDSGGLGEEVKRVTCGGKGLEGLEGEYYYGRVVGGDGRKRMVVDAA